MNTMETILVIYTVIAFIVSFVELVETKEWVLTPKNIYDNSTFNMFGSCVLWFLLRFFSPIVSICAFIYFIFHVGRKPKDE